jgi:predicted lipoprotein
MEGMKLATPLGLRDGGVPQPDQAEAPFAERSIEALAHNLEGLQAVYTSTWQGKEGVSLSDDMAQRQPDLNQAILDQIAACREADEAIPRPLTEAVTASPEAVQAAFDCHKELLRLLQADLAAALGVTPTFNDNDGD